jgi:hypothetical protein
MTANDERACAAVAALTIVFALLLALLVVVMP